MSQKRIIKAPFNFASLPPLETDSQKIHGTFDMQHHAIVTYALDPKSLERFMHKRYACEKFTDSSGAEKGLFSIAISQSTPHRLSRIERFFDRPPFNCVSYRALTQDKIHWQNSCWQFGTFLKSLFYCRFPRITYGMPLFNAPVHIDQKFDLANMRYEKFHVTTDGVDNIGKLDIELEDTGVPLLEAPVFEGFDSNESMLSALCMPQEYVTHGAGTTLYRQGTQCLPFHPSVGKLKRTKALSFLCDTMGLGDIDLEHPHSVLLQHRVENTQTLSVEVSIEEENDPHAGSNSSNVTDRVTKKAMNRAFAFRDEIRDRAYADAETERTRMAENSRNAKDN